MADHMPAYPSEISPGSAVQLAGDPSERGTPEQRLIAVGFVFVTVKYLNAWTEDLFHEPPESR